MYKLLDLYCGAGIAAIGYGQSGFHTTGVDIQQKSQYAGEDFILADALEVLADVDFCRQFDAIHASPPCQRHSVSTAQFRAAGKVYPELIEPTRILLDRIGLPYVIENVYTAPIRKDIVLRGTMFGLNVIRKRIFELGNWWTLAPLPPKQIGTCLSGDFCTIIGKQGYKKSKDCPKGWRPKFDQGSGLSTWAYAMGIPPEYQFRDVEISESIPPAYAKYVGDQLIHYLNYQQNLQL